MRGISIHAQEHGYFLMYAFSQSENEEVEFLKRYIRSRWIGRFDSTHSSACIYEPCLKAYPPHSLLNRDSLKCTAPNCIMSKKAQVIRFSSFTAIRLRATCGVT